MRICKPKKNIYFFLISCLILQSCISTAKLDAHVAEQYNNILPKQEKLRNDDISINSSVPFSGNKISSSAKKTSKVLPLIVYWQYDYRHSCSLNPVIGINYLIKSINSHAKKSLAGKIAGKKLEIAIEQMPNMFSIVDKGHIVLLLVRWHRLYVEPEKQDLVVSYKLTSSDGTIKTNQLTVKNKEQNEGIRFGQSWKSSSTEYLARYAQYMNTMGKELVEQISVDL